MGRKKRLTEDTGDPLPKKAKKQTLHLLWILGYHADSHQEFVLQGGVRLVIQMYSKSKVSRPIFFSGWGWMGVKWNINDLSFVWQQVETSLM